MERVALSKLSKILDKYKIQIQSLLINDKKVRFIECKCQKNFYIYIPTTVNIINDIDFKNLIPIRKVKIDLESDFLDYIKTNIEKVGICLITPRYISFIPKPESIFTYLFGEEENKISDPLMEIEQRLSYIDVTKTKIVIPKNTPEDYEEIILISETGEPVGTLSDLTGETPLSTPVKKKKYDFDLPVYGSYATLCFDIYFCYQNITKIQGYIDTFLPKLEKFYSSEFDKKISTITTNFTDISNLIEEIKTKNNTKNLLFDNLTRAENTLAKLSGQENKNPKQISTMKSTIKSLKDEMDKCDHNLANLINILNDGLSDLKSITDEYRKL